MIKYTIHKAKHFVQINVRGTYTACIHKTTTKYSSQEETKKPECRKLDRKIYNLGQ